METPILTPMQQAIELLKQKREMVHNEYRLSDDVQEMEELSYQLDGLDFGIKTLKNNLPKEQEAIERTWNDCNEAKWSSAPKLTATEYFNQTYKG